MSISNLVVQPHAAYLVADSGFFDQDGRIVGLLPKSISLPEVPAVIAPVGSGSLACRVFAEMPAWLAENRFTFGGFIELVRSMYQKHELDPVKHYTRWQAAIFCQREKKPLGLSFFTNPADGTPGQKPWTWYKVNPLILPHVAPAEWRTDGSRVSLWDPAQFNPEQDFEALVRAQGRYEFPGGQLGAAGEVRLSKVTKGGIEERMICDLGGEIGQCVSLSQLH